MSESPEVATVILDGFANLTPTMQSHAQGILLKRENWTRAMLEAVENGDLDLTRLSLDQKQSLSRHPNQEIAGQARKVMERSGALPSPDREKVIAKFLPLLERPADVAKGKEVFKNICSKCHTHSGEGAHVGPDLTGMAVHPKSELIVHILDPNRSVEGNYRQYTVVTRRGEVFNGMLASETKTTVELIDNEGKTHPLLREDIQRLQASRSSVMPEGFEKQVSQAEILNLLEFLTNRGKYLPIPLAKAATIVSTRGMFFSKTSRTERLVFPDWSPKTFAGVPFQLVDPQGDRVPNVIMLHGPNGNFPPRMPRSVTLPCNSRARAIHFLSGVSGWGAKSPRARGSVSMIVRLSFADDQREDHELLDGQHFADYIGHYDVPKSKLAFKLRGQQIRYFAIYPKRQDTIKNIELLKGRDRSAPIVMSVTVESP